MISSSVVAYLSYFWKLWQKCVMKPMKTRDWRTIQIKWCYQQHKILMTLKFQSKWNKNKTKMSIDAIGGKTCRTQMTVMIHTYISSQCSYLNIHFTIYLNFQFTRYFKIHFMRCLDIHFMRYLWFNYPLLKIFKYLLHKLINKCITLISRD